MRWIFTARNVSVWCMWITPVVTELEGLWDHLNFSFLFHFARGLPALGPSGKKNQIPQFTKYFHVSFLCKTTSDSIREQLHACPSKHPGKLLPCVQGGLSGPRTVHLSSLYLWGVTFFLVFHMHWFFFYSQNKPEIGRVLLSPLDEQEKKWGTWELKQHFLYPQSK